MVECWRSLGVPGYVLQIQHSTTQKFQIKKCPGMYCLHFLTRRCCIQHHSSYVFTLAPHSPRAIGSNNGGAAILDILSDHALLAFPSLVTSCYGWMLAGEYKCRKCRKICIVLFPMTLKIVSVTPVWYSLDSYHVVFMFLKIWRPVGHRVGHRVGQRVGHGLHHGLGHIAYPAFCPHPTLGVLAVIFFAWKPVQIVH